MPLIVQLFVGHYGSLYDRMYPVENRELAH